MKILAIDPGNEKSGWVIYENGKVLECGIDANADLMLKIEMMPEQEQYQGIQFAIEMIACYGMSVGKEVFNTCVWVGRFFQQVCESFGQQPQLVFRKDVKMHLCGKMQANDASIRKALIQRYGEPGTKKKPGPTYGVKSHIWAALGVASTANAYFRKSMQLEAVA